MLVSNLSAMIEWLKAAASEVREATLDEENRLTIPVAVCLTKMDRHPEQLNRAREFLKEQLGSVYAIIERAFRDFRVYACSAYGSAAASRSGAGRAVSMAVSVRGRCSSR
jgi:hypothetical protein